MINHKSKQLFEQSKEYIPGGVNSPVRAFQAVKRNPIFIEKALGSKLYDVDGNEYIDYVCSWGPCILGHNHPNVIEAVKKACDHGLSYGAPTEREYILAGMIRECIPSMEMTRLVNSGTEAVMSAIRVARGYTKRDMIVKFKGCYHGHSDGLLVKAGSGALTQSIPDSMGVPVDYSKNTLVADYNNQESVEALYQQYGAKIAAVIVEPVAANMGLVLPKDGFLSFLREITKKNGSLLIFDEVITGFRLGLGGAQELYGVKPDLTTLGKIIGGGMPVGAYGGRRDIMEQVAPVGPVYQAGTLSGNPIATAAGITTIESIKSIPDFYEQLEGKTNKIVKSIQSVMGSKVIINHIGSLFCTFFQKEEESEAGEVTKVTDYDSATKADTDKYAEYFSYLIEKGIYLAPSQYEAQFVSYAHSQEDIEKTCNIIREYHMDILEKTR